MKGGKRDMKTAKLGAIFLISVLTLAGIGAGYAAWTDTIFIKGTVKTGSVGWKFVEYSGTWVYKVPDGVPGADDPALNGIEIAVRHYTYPAGWKGPLMVNGWIPVAHAKAYEGIDDHHAIVEFENLFPCIDFIADVVIEYTGSVPGKINDVGFEIPPDTNFWPEDSDDLYPTDPEEYIDYFTTLTCEIYDAADNLIYQGVPELGLQLHQGYKIHLVMLIHIEQEWDDGTQTDELMGLSGDFGVFAEIVQWNEWPYDPDA
jgi:hypothetical protein